MKQALIIVCLILSLDIRSEDCNTPLSDFSKPVSLKGGWFFTRGDNIDWKEPESDDTRWQRKGLPDYTKEQEKRPFGFYWYRCPIFLPDTLPTTLSVNLGKIRDADEVYWNGALIGKTGNFLPNIEVDIEKERIYSIPDSLLRPGKNVLAIRAYSTTRFYGLVSTPYIGKEIDVYAKSIKTHIFPILSGFVFVSMGIFFIIGSLVRSNNQSNLLFSLFSIFLGLYTLLRTNFRYKLFHDFAFSYSFELVLLFSLPILFVNFLTQYLELKRKWHTYLYDLFQLGLVVYAYFARTPEKWLILIDLNAYFLLLPAIYVILILYKFYQVTPKKVKYILYGTLGLLPTVVLDTLRALEFISTPPTLHFGFLFFLVNISIQLSEEMVANYKNFQKQEAELMKMERVKTNFLFNVASEVREYLDKAIVLCREILVGPKTEVEIVEKLTKLESANSLMKAIINDAIVLNSIETGKYELFAERFTLPGIIEEVLQTLRIRYGETHSNIFIQVSENLELNLNRELVFLLLYHLLENEFLYTPSQTKIQVKAYEMNGKVFMEISDDGPGISSDADVFKKFVRGNIAIEQNIPGTGIGLTLAKAICKIMKGKISLESIPNVGIKVFVELPKSL